MYEYINCKEKNVSAYQVTYVNNATGKAKLYIVFAKNISEATKMSKRFTKSLVLYQITTCQTIEGVLFKSGNVGCFQQEE